MPIFRFKGEVLLVLGVVVLLATGVSNVQIPRAQASTQANTQALQILVNNKEPVAIVFHLCHFHEKTPTQAASCPMWGNYYYVHNGMALADLKENEPRAEIGHVAEWLTPVKWSICSLDHIRTHPQECKHGCPSMAPPKDCKENEAYWVRDRTLGEYNSSVTIENQSITVKKVPIAFRVGSEAPHNGVFVCFLPSGKTKCLTTIPSTTQPSSGTLYYEHYVNKKPGPGEGGDYAYKPTAFELNDKASTIKGEIEAVDLKTLKFT